MPLYERYRRQAALLVEMIPFAAAERDFALKGGTAINLFVRDMPRLSVDIDLTYVPVAPRQKSLAAIDAAMKRMAVAIRAEKTWPACNRSLEHARADRHQADCSAARCADQN